MESRESASKIVRGRGKVMPTRKVARKSAPAPTKPAPAKSVEVQVVITVIVDSPQGDERTYEDFRRDIEAALTDANGIVRAKRVTNTGGHYFVDGKVCLPNDYDPKTRGFKPGCHPPLWAMAADDRAILQRIEREKSLPGIARQPENLRTSKETDEFHKLDNAEKRKAETKRVLDDLHDNSEWGKQKKAEQQRAEEEARNRALEDDDEEEPWDEDDAEDAEDVEEEWDEEDPFDDEVAEEALSSQTSSVLARLRGGSNGGTTTKKLRVVKRR